jgi:putative peptidoglycan lipid II flippase
MHPVPESSPPNSSPEIQDNATVEQSSEQPITKVGRSMVNIAAIVAVATLVSKLFGLVRQVAIAAAFGDGPAYDAYNYAYVVPGFLLILLGGINGPFHSAIVSVLAKRDKREAGPLVETITTLITLILMGVSVALFLAADPLIRLTAPGLNEITHKLAVQQLQIMAPMALLAGLIGIGFGTLSSADMYWLPSISPLLSSVTVILGIGGLWLTLGKNLLLPENAMMGGAVLAGTTLVGAVLQWLIQIPPQWKAGLGTLRPRFNFRRDGVAEVMKVLGPATFSSGTLQINVWVDLFFISSIAGAASGMGYANLLVQTPLGILSSMILVPMLPAFAKLAAPENWPQLKGRIRQGLMLTAVSMLPLGALMISLAQPIVQLVYQRGAFATSAAAMTTGLLMSYSFGMFVYLARDLMVRVFYGLGDGDTPFKISIINILLNALFDWFFAKVLGWDAPGIVLSTVAVNLISLVVFLLILDRRLNGLPLMRWAWPVMGLTGASILAGIAAYLVHCATLTIGDNNIIFQGVRLGVAGLVGLITYWWLGSRLNLPEFAQVTGIVQRKLRR